jgi:3-dehydroquinate synthase
MQIFNVRLGPRSYDIAIGGGIDDAFASFVRDRLPLSARALVIADTHTQPLAERFRVALGTGSIAAVPAGEASKSLETAGKLFSQLAAMEADRKTPVVAVGGGVVGDLAGFVAATYNRGLPLLMIPTTLLAMVDSSVGGKVAINLPEGKNLVGAFHQPAGVWIDTALLATLPERQFSSGLAEVVKYGVILDAEFFAWLEANAEAVLRRDPAAVEHVVATSCRLKADVVEKDEREETGLRMVLNYGHTFAHAFETVSGYGTWLHGEAVAAGMVCASRLAERQGLITPEVTARQMALLARFGLPTSRPPEWYADDLLAVMRRDKKNVAGRLRFVLPTQIGHVGAFDDVPEAAVREVLAIP